MTYTKVILDLDPNLCQNFLFFVTLSILYIEVCMVPLWKGVCRCHRTDSGSWAPTNLLKLS